MKNNKTYKIIAVTALAAVIVGLAAFAGYRIYRYCTTVTIAGQTFSKSVSSIDLSGSDISNDISKLGQMQSLKSADLTNTGITAEQFEILSKQLKDCDIKWSVPLGEHTYSNQIESLTLTDDVAPEQLKNLRYFNRLTTLDACGYPLCDELYDATLAVSGSDCNYIFADTLYGKDVDNETEKLDLSKNKISDISEFYQKLRFFPNIKEIYVGNCKVSDEEMDKLNQDFSGTKFVWLVEFGHWQVRTDVKVFSTLIGEGNRKTYDQEEFSPLLNYCTELKALDLGHHNITDLNGFIKFTDLEVLCLCDAKFSDISAIVNFPKLHYLELFHCYNITDLSPLGELKNLEDLNIYDLNSVKNLDALKKCTKLNFIFGGHTYPKGFTWDDLREYFPDCKIDTEIHSPVGNGWRATDKNVAVRTAFGNWDKVVSYESWDNVTYRGEITIYSKIT